MNFRSAPGIMLIVSALFICAVNVFLMRNKALYSGDEIISYLCATVNQEHYSTVLKHQHPYGTISDAETWKNYLSIHEPFAFGKIATDLTKTDLHPPLYFWLLHCWVLLFGIHPFTAILLNMLLQLLSLFPLYKLGRLLLKDETKAGIAVLLWSITPVFTGITPFARQYMLLSLIHICYAFAFVRFMQQHKRFDLFAITLLAALGLLTHYSFLYAGCCYFVMAIILHKKERLTRPALIILSWIIAVCILWLLHPHFTDSFILQQQRADSFSAGQLVARAGKTMLSCMQFLFPFLLLKPLLLKMNPVLLIVMAGSISTFIFIWIIRFYKKGYLPVQKGISMILRSPLLVISILMTLAAIVPYITFIFPFHAMGGQYLVMLYPYFAMLLSLLIVKKAGWSPLLIGCLLAGTGCALFYFSYRQAQYAKLITMISEKDLVIVNSADRRSFPRLIPYLKNGQKVLVIEETDQQYAEILLHAQELYPDHVFIASVQTGYGQPPDMTDPAYDLQDGVSWVVTGN